MSTGDFKPKGIEQTHLFIRLTKPFADPRASELAAGLAQALPDICKIASDRMKLMPALHPEFTLHDECHLLRVTELMAKVVPQGVLDCVMNPAEVALLILSAHFHDTGMVPDATETRRLRASGEYDLFRQNWLSQYVGFSDAARMVQTGSAPLADRQKYTRIVAEFEDAMFSRFIRGKHHELAREFVREGLGQDKRLRVGTGQLAEPLGLLCLSHGLPADSITDAQGFFCDRAVGTCPVNLAYLASVLRLADILDFDRERTPDEIYRSINFNSPVSIQEWEKHRQVEGWRIDRETVRFECACERPEYERAIRRYLQYIDDELAAANDRTRRFPAAFAQYKLDLPSRTDGSRIRAKNDCYIYAADLEVSLNRDEIVRLLMTEKLYGHPSLAIRELLQNAWDALRHRKAIMKRDDGVEWTAGRVDFEHGVNADGREFVRCSDNGVGMTERIVKEYLVRSGRSYYRSPEFERERLTFARANADFDPCARFGIGFMSLFMLGEDITIRTRRYGGSGTGMAEPLIVEIRGLDSLIVLRRGQPNQPAGTTVEVVGRRKPESFVTWKDRVRLTDTIYAYALAGEFPVRGTCSIPEIKDEIDIPPGVADPWHPFTEFGVRKGVVFQQGFKEIDARLDGKVSCGVPVSDDGSLTTGNDEAGWKQSDGGHGAHFYVSKAQEEKFQVWTWEGRTCLDGILVAGPHGRGKRHHLIVGSQYPNPIAFGQDLFVLDVRGTLKPELTPDRAPPTRTGLWSDSGTTWRRLRRIAARAHGALWQKVIERFSDQANAEVLWQLMALHRVPFETIPRGVIWDRLVVPTIDADGSLAFRRFEELGPIPFHLGAPQPFATERDGRRIGVTEKMNRWRDINKQELVSPAVRSVVLSMASVTIQDGQPTLEFKTPEQPTEPGFNSVVFDWFARRYSTVPFGGELTGSLAMVASERMLNRCHAITEYLLSHQETSLDEPKFQFLHCLGGAVLEEGALEALANEDYTNRRMNLHFSSLGLHYRGIDIANMEPELRPPYRCWLPGTGFVDIDDTVLRRLGDVQLVDWERIHEQRRM